MNITPNSVFLKSMMLIFFSDQVKIFLLILFFLSSCSSFYIMDNSYSSQNIAYEENDTFETQNFEVENVEIQTVEMFEHIVSSGETLGLIANWYTGETANWEEIQFSNPTLDPLKMVVGELVLIPMHLVIRQESLPKSLTRQAQSEELKKNKENTKAIPNVKTERELLLEELLNK